MEEKDYTELAQRLNEQYVKEHPFHGAPVSMNDDRDADFDLRDAAGLIRAAKIEKQQILRQIEAERGSQDALAQAREDVSLLPDRETERIQAGWVEAAAVQAKNYAQSRNAGATPKAFDPNDKEQKDIRDGVISWIKKQKMRGNFGGRKTLNKN